MIYKILDAAGVLYPKPRFPKLPETTCVIPMDSVEADGADGRNFIYYHDVSLEVYAKTPDPEAEAALEAQLNARGIKWTKQARYWLQDIQRYQTVYEFNYTEKI